MNISSLPDVTLPASDHHRLERLARAGADQGDMDARFLLGEINRAEIVPDRAVRLDGIVTMGSLVTFRATCCGSVRETRRLVYPEDYTSERTQISVTSPLGAALVGLQVGSEIPFYTAGCTNVVRVERVSRGGPNDVVRALFCKPAVKGKQPFADDDPGPSAA